MRELGRHGTTVKPRDASARIAPLLSGGAMPAAGSIAPHSLTSFSTARSKTTCFFQTIIASYIDCVQSKRDAIMSPTCAIYIPRIHFHPSLGPRPLFLFRGVWVPETKTIHHYYYYLKTKQGYKRKRRSRGRSKKS